ncbi:MAG: glycosyltransferase [Lachnospiraceae bacterium]|nr:glycosyltransferase [Lachnospiraceae bacterium]
MKVETDLLNEENEVMVSVCCAAYNHGKYIEQTLQGFVSQITNFRFEVIVHDDASTDNTKSVIQKYVDLYPDLFVPIYETENQYSKGKGTILRIVAPKIRGKYVAHCEGDDYWSDEHKLQKQYDALESNPDCSICVHRAQSIWEDGSLMDKSDARLKLPKKGYGLQPGVIEKEQMAAALWLNGGYPFHTSSYFHRRSIIEDQINGKAEFVKYMNGDMARLRLCLNRGKFFFIGETMSHRRRGVPGSWNARWEKTDIQEKLKHLGNQIIGDRMFDEYSNYQFHDYISVLCFNLTAECWIYDTGDSKKYKKYVKENPLSLKVIHDKASLWLYIRYLIMRVSPRFYKLLYKIQIKLIKRGISS